MPDYMYHYQEGNLPGYNNIFDRADLFNMLNDKEVLNRQARLSNEGVNNMVAAYFIKNVQQKRNSIVKSAETVATKDDSVPASASSDNKLSDIQADLNNITNNQLNTVNDMMKKIIEKDFTK
jgi:hypothetical protein